MPKEALNQIEALQVVAGNEGIEELVEVYTRGKEIIVVLNRY